MTAVLEYLKLASGCVSLFHTFIVLYIETNNKGVCQYDRVNRLLRGVVLVLDQDYVVDVALNLS